MKKVNHFGQYTIKFCFLLTILILSFPLSTFAKEEKKRVTINEQTVEAFVKDYYELKFNNKEAFGEMSINIVGHNNQILFQGRFRDPNAKNKNSEVQEKTPYYLGSIAKTVTAIAVMQLVEKGKIDLNEDINNYLKDFKIENPFNKTISMKNLLTYSAGFDEPNPPEFVYDKQQQMSLKDFLITFQPHIIREPGSSVMYDNYAYDLAGYIVEHVSGMPFNEYINEYIFTTLEMKQSSFRFDKSLHRDMAMNYSSSGETKPIFFTVPIDMPSGGLVSTSSDMANFMSMLLNKGKFRGKKIISEDSFNKMIHEQFPMIGYGLDILHYHNQKVIRKGGDIGNYHSVFWILPDHQIGIFITVSGYAGDFSNFIKKFIDHFFSDSDVKSSNDYGTTPTNQNAKEKLNKLTGTYQYIRQSEATYRKLINFFRGYSQIEVKTIDNGKIAVNILGHKRIFSQINEFIFEEENNETLGNNNQLTFFKVEDNFTYLQMPEESTFFKKVNWYDKLSLHKYLFLIFAVLFLFLTIYLLFSNRKKGKRNIQKLAFWNCILYFMFFPSLLLTVWKVMDGASQKLMFFPLVIPIIALIISVFLITNLIKNWSNYRLYTKIFHSFIIVLSLSFIILLNYWNLFMQF